MEPLRQDQDDFAALISADSFCATTPVLSQHKGVTESDITEALAGLHVRAGKMGSCVVVLMPELKPDPSETPAARYDVRVGLQVIVQPLFADDPATGVRITAEQLAERVRQLCHSRSFGRPATFMFDGMDPLPSDPGKESYLVYFKRKGGDTYIPRVATPGLAGIAAYGGYEITLNVPTGATGYYTTNGTLPTPLALPYTGPFVVMGGATVRAAAVQTGCLQSETTQRTFA